MKHLHFIGIGGTAMGAVAVACQQYGFIVTGSDTAVYPPMSSFLRESKIQFFEGYSENNLRRTEPDTIIVGNAISRGNIELEYALNNHIPLISMPELVKNVLIHKNTSIVISGTHGKTTTSSLTAWLLESAGKQPGFLIGAIPGNFSQGCRPVTEDYHNTRSGFFVSEGDEYDTAFFDKRSKFLHYRPDILVINNCEFDHADIFDSLDAIQNSFRLCTRLVPGNGLILVNGDDKNAIQTVSSALSEIQTFGLGEHNTLRAYSIDYSPEGTTLSVSLHGQDIGTFSMALAGEFNVRNALAAIGIAHHIGISTQEIQQGLSTFCLPKRRMETIAVWNNCTIIDDFAHHPTAIAETLRGIAQKYPNNRIIAVFEPRSNSTTINVFQEQLAQCFDNAAIVLFGAINRPERYAPERRLNLELLAEKLCAQGKKTLFLTTEQSSDPHWGIYIKQLLETIIQDNDIIVLLSNGNIGGLRELLK